MRELGLYGSRAMGCHHQGYAIDLTLVAPALAHHDRQQLRHDLDDRRLPRSLDLSLHHELPGPWREQVARVGRRLAA